MARSGKMRYRKYARSIPQSSWRRPGCWQVKIMGPLIVYLSYADVPMRCYTCTSTEAGSQCETNPSLLAYSILDACSRDACTIVRVEEWPSRRVKSVIDIFYIRIISLFPFNPITTKNRSFYRGCDGRTKVFERNNCQIEKDERTCFTACVGDLCNLGDGLVADNIVHSASISPGYGAGNRVFMTIAPVLVTFSLWVTAAAAL